MNAYKPANTTSKKPVVIFLLKAFLISMAIKFKSLSYLNITLQSGHIVY